MRPQPPNWTRVAEIFRQWDESDPNAAVLSITKGGWIQLSVGGETRSLPATLWMQAVLSFESTDHAVLQRRAHGELPK